MGRQDILSAMVAFHLLMYTMIGWITAASITSTTEGYYQSLPDPLFAVILVICHAAQCQNPSRTLNISPVSTHLLLPYKSTDCATALYIAPRDCTIDPVLSSTLVSIYHRFRAFHRCW